MNMRMVSRTTLALALALMVLNFAVAPARATTLPAGFAEETLAAGLTQPTAVAWTPDGRMLVAEKPGRLKVVNPSSTSATTVLDISSRVNSDSDRGLLGLAVDTAYATNQYVYLLYAYELNPLTPDGDGAMVSQLLRIKLSAASVVSDETVLLGSYTSGPCPTAAESMLMPWRPNAAPTVPIIPGTSR